MAAQNTPPQDPGNIEQSRAPASAHSQPHNEAATSPGEVTEGSGGIMDTLAAYRSMIMALAGLGLLGGGGFVFWKKKQGEMA
jgi:LPXTG-motif cell wall-anchored protein